MEIQGFSCHGCGSTDVVFDPVTRKLHCNQCGREEYYSRAQLGATGKVAFAKDNAIKFFKSGNRKNAREFAQDILNSMQDNASALFIISYYDEFVEGKAGAMHDFFHVIDEVALERDEVNDLMDLFATAIYNLRDFEQDIVTLIVKNMQSMDDRKRLSAFIDYVCPYCIGKYPSSDFLTEDRTSFYCDLAGNCDIPKTCLALLKGIQLNPDSPYRSDSFYMKARTEYFYKHYVLEVGKVIANMTNSPYKEKFERTYNAIQKKYQEDAKAV